MSDKILNVLVLNPLPCGKYGVRVRGCYITDETRVSVEVGRSLRVFDHTTFIERPPASGAHYLNQILREVSFDRAGIPYRMEHRPRNCRETMRGFEYYPDPISMRSVTRFFAVGYDLRLDEVMRVEALRHNPCVVCPSEFSFEHEEVAKKLGGQLILNRQLNIPNPCREVVPTSGFVFDQLPPLQGFIPVKG